MDRQVDAATEFSIPLRLEERFFENEDTAFQIRHRFRFVYPLPETKAYLIAADELFVYFNSINHGRLATAVQSGANHIWLTTIHINF